VYYQALDPQLSRKPPMVCRLGTLCVSSAVGSRLPLGNADPGDGDPRRRITRRKSVDQALDYFSSSTDAVVLIFRKGPTFAVPLRLRCRDAFGVID
jgi:hypothetical protein